ncbi:hypothetical protein Plhal304r1_c002g0006641 [Plasmopara halstedii]
MCRAVKSYCPTVLESDPFNSQDVTMRKRVISTRDYYQRFADIRNDISEFGEISRYYWIYKAHNYRTIWSSIRRRTARTSG